MLNLAHQVYRLARFTKKIAYVAGFISLAALIAAVPALVKIDPALIDWIKSILPKTFN